MITMVGLDPGKSAGICVARAHEYKASWKYVAVDWYQMNHRAVPPFLQWQNSLAMATSDTIYLFAERYVTSSIKAGNDETVTRDLLREAPSAMYAASYHEAQPSEVKPWAADRKLRAAGLLYPGEGTAMRHANDAARVLLYLSCNLGLMSNPLR